MQFVFGSAMISDIAGIARRNLFGPKDKVSSYEKLVLRSGVRFLFLFVLMDTILLNLDLQLGRDIDKKILGLGSISWGHCLEIFLEALV